MKLKELASHLLSLDPQRNPARLAFYHYLKNFRRLDEDLTSEVIESFYDRALGFQQWQGSVKELGQTVAADLKSILTRHSLGAAEIQVRHADQVQWIDLIQSADFRDLLAEEGEVFKKEGDDLRLIDLPSGEVLRIRRQAKHGLVRIEVKTRRARVEGRKLRLVRPTTELVYGADLELAQSHVQVLQISPLKFARFSVADDLAAGLILQGAGFTKSDSFTGPIDQCAEVFWPLKALEKYFVNPVTDTYYLRILGDLEAALSALKKFHPNREVIAKDALKKAELYRDRVFADDKVLGGMISTLLLNLRRDDAEGREQCRPIKPLSPYA